MSAYKHRNSANQKPANGDGETRAGRGDRSERKHLTSREVERLIEATKGSRNEARDRCLLLMMFRHGLWRARQILYQMS